MHKADKVFLLSPSVVLGSPTWRTLYIKRNKRKRFSANLLEEVKSLLLPPPCIPSFGKSPKAVQVLKPVILMGWKATLSLGAVSYQMGTELGGNSVLSFSFWVLPRHCSRSTGLPHKLLSLLVCGNGEATTQNPLPGHTSPCSPIYISAEHSVWGACWP